MVVLTPELDEMDTSLIRGCAGGRVEDPAAGSGSIECSAEWGLDE